MTFKDWVALTVAAVLAGVGLLTLTRSFGHWAPGDAPRLRVLITLHDAARAGFWFALAGFFVAYVVVDDPDAIRYILVVPIALAGVRLLAAQAISRSLPPEG